jgi:hypothetical protein
MTANPDSGQYLTYWLSRDESDEGVMSEQVDVWLERPTRYSLAGGGAVWLGSGESGLDKRFAIWTTAAALQNCRVYPDTSRECIRVGDEPAPVKNS